MNGGNELRSGGASLSWAQRYTWFQHYRISNDQRHEWNISIRLDAPEGATLDSIEASVNHFVGRHETLRATYALVDGGEPVRQVPPARPLAIDHFVIDVSGPSPYSCSSQFFAREFDLESEWPIRVAVMTEDDVPRHVLIALHHTAIDGSAIRTILEELRAIHECVVRGIPIELGPPPADLSAVDSFESSADGVAANDATLRHWADRGWNMQVPLLWRRRKPYANEAPAHGAALALPSLIAATRVLAARHKVWPSVVLMAAFVTLTSVFSGDREIYFRAFMSNREQAWQKDLVACLYQPALLRIEVDQEATFAEVVERAGDEYWEARNHSYCAYDVVLEELARASYHRGAPIRVAADFNYLNNKAFSSDVTRPVLIRHEPPLPWASADEDFHLRISEWRDCIIATAYAMSTSMSAAELEIYLRKLGAVVEEAAACADLTVREIVALVGLPPYPRYSGRIVQVGGMQVSTSMVAACLEAHSAVREVRLDREIAGGGEEGLVAHVYSVEPDLTPSQLRAHFLSRMYDFPAVRCPSRFVVYGVQGDLLRSGSGTDEVVWAPSTEQEMALAAAVRTANGSEPVNLVRSYVLAGGRAMSIPRVQQILRADGWVPPGLSTLISARPLGRVATELRKVPPLPAAPGRP